MLFHRAKSFLTVWAETGQFYWVTLGEALDTNHKQMLDLPWKGWWLHNTEVAARATMERTSFIWFDCCFSSLERSPGVMAWQEPALRATKPTICLFSYCNTRYQHYFHYCKSFLLPPSEEFPFDKALTSFWPQEHSFGWVSRPHSGMMEQDTRHEVRIP